MNEPRQMPILLLNTSIVTAPGTYRLSDPISEERARDMIEIGFVSAIGHDAAARALSTILGVDVPVNRVPSVQMPHQVALVLKVRGRLPEGVILDDAGLRAIGFDLLVLTRLD